MQMITDVNNYLSLEDDYGKIKNEQILIVGKTGSGKSLASEGIVEKLHNLKKKGYIVMVIADPKDELEYAYQMFLPREKYHLDILKKIGKRPERKKVKIYHPFTFNIPNTFLPEINFYTLPLKELGRKEWSIIAETMWDTETIRLLLHASQDTSDEDGIYSFLHYIQSFVKGKHIGKKRKPDPRAFYLDVGSGTSKSITEISNYMQPFKKDFFLAKKNCALNLDWKSILTDQINYHVFVSNWIRDEKLKDFLVLALLNGIVENKRYLKNPIVVVIPEIRKQCPFKPEGHKIFLADAIKDNLSLMRSSGKGMSSVLDTQVYWDVHDDIRDTVSITLIGQLGGGADMEKVAKFFNYKREIRDQIKKMDYEYSFFLVGNEGVGGITIFPPSSMHSEPEYNFFEIYKQEYPEKMRKYNELINMMGKMYDEEENKIKEKVKRIDKMEKEEKKKVEKEKETKKEIKVEKVTKEIKSLKKERKKDIMKRCFEARQENPDMSWRELGKKMGLNYKTVQKYVEEFGKNKSEKEYVHEIEEPEVETIYPPEELALPE